LKIKQTAHGTHIFKRNLSPAIPDKRCTWNTIFSNRKNYRHTTKADFNQTIFNDMWQDSTMMRDAPP
jgi:hypothetical protein